MEASARPPFVRRARGASACPDRKAAQEISLGKMDGKPQQNRHAQKNGQTARKGETEVVIDRRYIPFRGRNAVFCLVDEVAGLVEVDLIGYGGAVWIHADGALEDVEVFRGIGRGGIWEGADKCEVVVAKADVVVARGKMVV